MIDSIQTSQLFFELTCHNLSFLLQFLVLFYFRKDKTKQEWTDHKGNYEQLSYSMSYHSVVVHHLNDRIKIASISCPKCHLTHKSTFLIMVALLSGLKVVNHLVWQNSTFIDTKVAICLNQVESRIVRKVKIGAKCCT